MTLGASGGKVKPLTTADIIELARNSPVTDVVMCGRAFGISEPVIRKMARSGELAKIVTVLRFGAQYRIPVADIMRVLEIDHGAPPAAEAPSAGASLSVVPPGTAA